MLNNFYYDNKPFLYISFFCSFILFIIELSNYHYHSAIIYILLFIILQNYSRNLALILFLSFLITLAFILLGSSKNQKEGFDPNLPEKQTMPPPAPDTSQPTSSSPVKEFDPNEVPQAAVNVDNAKPLDGNNTISPPTPPASLANVDGPSPQPADADTLKAGGAVSKPDYATTINEAYGNLNNMIGGEGIEKLTSQTSQLLAQQNKLVESMKGLTPLMDNAKSLIDTFKGLDLVSSVSNQKS